MNETLAEKIKRLNEEVFTAHEFDIKLFAELTEMQRELGILDKNRPFCPFLRPHFFARSRYEKIARAAADISEAFERLTIAAIESEDILDELDLTEREKQLAKINPRYKGVSNSSRLDSFVCGEEFKFLECNGESPAGITDQMQIEKILQRVPAVKKFLAENKHWSPKPHEKLLQALVTAYRDFGGAKAKPNIAIVDWRGVGTETEFENLRVFFEAEGHKTRIIDPRDLEYDGKILRVGEFEIDVFYKRVVLFEFLEKFDDSHPLIRAYKDGNVCMANSFRSKIPHKKASFAILSDEKYEKIFTNEQLETIRKHIPWTRRLREGKTIFQGETIDLLEFLRRERERFLIKPNDDYGGKGVVLGWETSQNDWEQVINESLQHSFVAQERAAVEKAVFPAYSDKVTMENLLIDFDPFLFAGKVEGGLVRLSASSIVNVAQGGGETAMFVLEDF